MRTYRQNSMTILVHVLPGLGLALAFALTAPC